MPTKRKLAALGVLLALVAASRLFGQADEIRRLQDIAGNAYDQAAAANETARLLQAKVDQQAGRISALENQLAAMNRAADEAATARAAAEAAAQRAAQQKLADDQWAAAAPERAREAAALQAAMEHWRASLPHTPNIIVAPNPATGGATVSVDGKLTAFKTLAEAKAYADAAKQKALATESASLGPATVKP